MRAYGIKGLQAHIRKGINLGKLFSELVRERGDLFEIVTTPAFGLTVFRVGDQAVRNLPASGKDSVNNEITQEVYERVNAGREIFITSSVIGGIYVIRVVNGNELGDEVHTRKAFDILVRISEEVLAEKRGVDLKN